jgi:hypothetical protein
VERDVLEVEFENKNWSNRISSAIFSEVESNF